MEKIKELKYKSALTDNPDEARKNHTIIKNILKEQRKARRRWWYAMHKEETRTKAQEWQQDTTPKSWAEIAETGAQLEKLAKCYGLIKELKNEGII